MNQTIWRLPVAMAESGYSRSTIYALIKQRLWPKQVRLGPRCIGWPQREIEALNAARISGKSDEEIRELVGQLEASRRYAGKASAGLVPNAPTFIPALRTHPVAGVQP